MEKFDELFHMVNDAILKDDIDKSDKGQEAGGARARKALSAIAKKAKECRKEILAKRQIAKA
jgi:hypothetical protein